MERVITLNVKDQRVVDIFKTITEQTSVIFSYTNFDDKQRVSKSYDHMPLGSALNDLMKDLSCSYILKGKYIIIRYDKIPLKTEKEGIPKNNIIHKDSICSLKTKPVLLSENIRASVSTAKIHGPSSTAVIPKLNDSLKVATRAYLFQVGMQITLAKPVGGKSELSNLGLGISLNYFIKPRIALALNMSQNSFALSNVPAYNSFHCSVAQFGLGGEYFLVNRTFKFYVSMDAGVYLNRVDYSYSYWALPYPNAFYISYVTVKESDEESAFGYAPGIGFSYRFNSRLCINSGIKYHVIQSKYGTIPYWYRNIGLLFSF
ncbi:MAG TPA: hypothetical protein VFF27_14830 [Bacteroidia bacterium]|nr:hypothetical protein [Bacteroidia bacterium]